MRAIPLLDTFPIYKVEHDCIVSKQGDITLAYDVTLPEIFTLSDHDYEAFHQVLVKAIKVLPRQSIFHKQDWFCSQKYTADFSNEELSFLAGASERFFNERPFLNHRCYIMLTQQPADHKVSTSMFSNLLRPSIVPHEAIDTTRIQEFLDSAGQFERILGDSGFMALKRIDNNQLAGSYQTAGLLERYCFLNPDTEACVVRDIHFKDGLKIGDQYSQLYTLADVEDLPSLCGSRINYDRYSTDKTKFSIGFASALGQLLSCNHIYNQYIFIQDVQKTIKRLEGKRLRLQSLSTYSRENAISRDATNEFLNEAIGAQRQPVKAHFNVLLWTDSKSELQDLKTKVSSALAQMDAVAKHETDGAPQIFWAGIPGNEGAFPMNDCFDTFIEQATCFLNLETSYRSSLSPVGIRLGDRLTGKPVHVDISDEPVKRGMCTNRNKFILGPSGSGKSFFTNHMVRSYYEQGTHIVLVDVGHSYKGLCDLVQGYYFTYNESNPIRFNPFYIGEGDTLDTEKKESIKTLLLALWKKDDETYNRSEYVALSISLQMYYERLQKNNTIFPCFDSYYDSCAMNSCPS